MERDSCKNRFTAKYESDFSTNTERKIALYMKENFDRLQLAPGEGGKNFGLQKRALLCII